MISICQEFADTSPAVIVELDLPSHLYLVLFDGVSLEPDLQA